MSTRHPYLSHFAGELTRIEGYGSTADSAARMVAQSRRPGQMSWSQYTCWKYVDTQIVLYPHLPYFSEQGTPAPDVRGTSPGAW